MKSLLKWLGRFVPAKPRNGLSVHAALTWLMMRGFTVEYIGERNICACCKRLTYDGVVYIDSMITPFDTIESASKLGYSGQAYMWCLSCVMKLEGVPKDDDSAYADVIARRLTK